MKKIIIAFSTYREARATLNLLRATVMNANNIYAFDLGYILITGIGGLAAATQLSTYLPLASIIWNLGVAGSLKEGGSIGSFFEIQSVSKFVHMPETIDEHSKKMTSSLYPSISTFARGKRLVTTEFPIHSEKLRCLLSSEYDLVDMEGYAIAYAASKANKSTLLWKWVSDFASLGGEKLIQQHLDQLSDEFAKFISIQLKCHSQKD